ncbi:MAG: hypothetical protein ACFFE1_13490 [Candidatus Thorarchaeota archaeon]
MDVLTWLVLLVVILLVAVFNYYMNLAPGTDPEDFQVGPPQLGITCDCSLTVLIIGGIVVLALSAVSGIFETRLELYLVGLFAFSLITIAGFIGRRKRHQEWRELRKAIQRAVPNTSIFGFRRAPMDIAFEEDDDEDSNDYYDEY